MIGPRQRRWAGLLEALPERIAAVHRWQGWREPPRNEAGHLHHVPTLIVCLAGVIRVERPDERRDLGPGELLIIAPGVWHRHSPPRGASVAWAQGFMSACSDIGCWDAAGWVPGTIPLQPSLLLVERLLATPTPASARELLRHVLREDVALLDQARHAAAERMLRAFWSGLHRGISADDLVRASNLGRSRAWQLFSAAYGLPPHRALLEARRSLAQGLLDAGLPPGEAARRAGFPDAASFARERRRRSGERIGATGTTPRRRLA